MKLNKIHGHSRLSDLVSLINFPGAVHKQTAKVTPREDRGIIFSKVNKNVSKIQSEDENSYDYGQLIARISKNDI